jgi:hypothetical protein
MADVPEPGPGEEAPTLSLFEDNPAPEDGADPDEPPSPGSPPAGGIRETILRFLEKEL